MKAGLLLGCFAAILVLLAFASPVEATTVCKASGNWCEGFAHVSTNTGGVGVTRCFAFRTVNLAPTCLVGGVTPANEAWEMAAGACTTLYYWNVASGGGVAPATPNKVALQVYSPAAAVRSYYLLTTGSVPANGDSFQFCATSDGTNTGSPMAGTFLLFVQAVKDNGAGGIGNYNIGSNGASTAGTVVSFDNGALRGQHLVSSIARNAYPAGSTFAYGPAGDESITITGTFSQPNGEGGVECMRTGVLDSATLTIGATGASVDVDAATTLAQSQVVDTTFPAANSPYVGVLLTGQCNAALTGLPWTVGLSS